jgi:hypothetical protein
MREEQKIKLLESKVVKRTSGSKGGTRKETEIIT